MNQPQNQQQSPKQDITSMYMWRLTRRLNKKHEKKVERDILRRMPH